MNKQPPKVLSSSADPAKWSATVKGILTSLLPILMVILDMPESQAQGLIDAIVNVVFAGTSLYAAGMTCYGLLRKVKLRRWTAQS